MKVLRTMKKVMIKTEKKRERKKDAHTYMTRERKREYVCMFMWKR